MSARRRIPFGSGGDSEHGAAAPPLARVALRAPRDARRALVDDHVDMMLFEAQLLSTPRFAKTARRPAPPSTRRVRDARRVRHPCQLRTERGRRPARAAPTHHRLDRAHVGRSAAAPHPVGATRRRRRSEAHHSAPAPRIAAAPSTTVHHTTATHGRDEPGTAQGRITARRHPRHDTHGREHPDGPDPDTRRPARPFRRSASSRGRARNRRTTARTRRPDTPTTGVTSRPRLPPRSSARAPWPTRCSPAGCPQVASAADTERRGGVGAVVARDRRRVGGRRRGPGSPRRPEQARPHDHRHGLRALLDGRPLHRGRRAASLPRLQRRDRSRDHDLERQVVHRRDLHQWIGGRARAPGRHGAGAAPTRRRLRPARCSPQCSKVSPTAPPPCPPRGSRSGLRPARRGPGRAGGVSPVIPRRARSSRTTLIRATSP